MIALLLFFILLLPGCYKVPIAQEFNRLKRTTKEITGSEIIYDSYNKYPDMECTIRATITNGLSRNEAVKTALMNNPSLQADFAKLGIAKADLIQAGLYTNPQTQNVFRFPTASQGPGTAQTNIESITTGKLSDLWQVPLRKRIFEDELEIITLRILTGILDIVENTKSAYDACVKVDLQLENEKIILSFTKELREEIYYRQGFGYSNDLDKYNVDAQVAIVQTAITEYEKERKRAYLHLTQLLGITPSSKEIILTDTILDSITIPSLSDLESYALEYRPEMQIARYKIKRYEDTIRFEKASVWKDVNIGIGFKQDFDKPFRGWGPAINFEIPLFDTNYAQIAKAEFEFERAKKKLRYRKIIIQEELRKELTAVHKEKREIAYYNTFIIPSYEKAIDYTYTYANTMQLNMLTALESQLTLYKAEQELIEKYYNLHIAFNKLERAYGKNIEPYEFANHEISCINA
ncbi:TolC family protein [Candidatus Dependentiae bacterium]|nr:TolC family protein [Candidatus Dependentiae bacterium]